MIVISIPFMVTISTLFVQPFLNNVELADLSFYTKIFDMIILGYVFKQTGKELDKTELLIFLTPRIIKESVTAVR